MKSDDILHVRDLCIRRGRTRILEAINWQVGARQHWVILGANGSGKTSLLSALTGYLTPTRGEVEVLGETFGQSDWRSLRSHIGLVSSSIRQLMPEHEPALITVASGRYAMIDFWGDPNAQDRRQARAILDMVQCKELADRPWLYLSQGERQRVLIGRALMANPKILILDEPCAGLDPAARESFLGLVDRLGRRAGGPNLILVTHHVEEITPAFTHALILSQGKVLAQGPIPKVVRSHILSAAFQTQATVRKTQGRLQLHMGRGKTPSTSPWRLR